MTRADLKNLHPDDVELWLCVEKAVWRLALAAKLPLSRVRPMPRRMVNMTQGFYITPPDAQDKEIWLSLRMACRVKTRSFVWSGERYALHQLLDTIMHEMAHCKAGCGADHGPRFFLEYAKMIVLAESIGIRFDLAAWRGKLKP